MVWPDKVRACRADRKYDRQLVFEDHARHRLLALWISKLKRRLVAQRFLPEMGY
jgi:hypothetical protein